MVIYTHPRLQRDTPRKNALNWSTLRQLRCAMWAKVSTAATWHAQCWRLWQQCPEKSQFLAHQFIYREVLDLFMFFCWMIISCSYRPLISHPYTKKNNWIFLGKGTHWLYYRSICCCCGFAIFQSTLYIQTTQEEGVFEVFRLNNLFYPVEMTFETVSPLKDFPWIKPSNFIRIMAKMNHLGHLLGGLSLQEAKGTLLSFWSKYRALFPQHQLWGDVDCRKKDLSRCLPIYLHGDEGTSYKRGGILIVSFQGAFGFGSSKRAEEIKEKYRAMGDGIPLNFLRTGFQTRMPICVCPKECLGLIINIVPWCSTLSNLFNSFVMFVVCYIYIYIYTHNLYI